MLSPAAGTLFARQTTAPAKQAPGPAKQEPQSVPEVPKVEATLVDDTAETVPTFFSPAQFATLRRLSALLMPPMKGHPGAVEAHAAEFLDFLLGESPAPRRELYCHGLDALDIRAQQSFAKPFANLDASQADQILRPLLMPVPWPNDPPEDSVKHFLSTVHQDVRTATVNSREWNLAAASSASRASSGSVDEYWYPIDPLYSIKPPPRNVNG